MKVVSWIFKIIAGVFLFTFIVTLPFTVLFRNTSQVLFDKETMFSLVNSNFLAPEFVASFGSHAVEVRILADESYETAIDELVVHGLGNLSDDEWLELAELVAPTDVVAPSLEQVLVGFYSWLDSSEIKPSFFVDLRPWKNVISKNTLPVFEIVLNGLDQCSANQLDAYGALGEITPETLTIPNCRPPEPYYSMLLDVAATQIPLTVAEWPNVVDISEELAGVDEDFDQAKIILQQTRTNAPIAWIPLVLLILIAIPMGARSVDGIFKWGGWPMLIAGSFTVVLALSVRFFTDGMILNLGLGAMTASMQTTIVAAIAQIALPTLKQGFAIFMIGALALVIGAVLDAIITKADAAAIQAAAEMSTVQSAIPVQAPVTPAPTSVESVTRVSATHPYQQPPKDAYGSSEKSDETEEEDGADDDSRPTGMFG